MMTIEPATPADAAGIAEVYVDTWRTTYAAILPHRGLLRMSPEQQARYWSSIIGNRAETHRVIVAREADRRVVGFASFGPGRFDDRPAVGRFALESSAKVGEIYTLYVRSDFQDRGIGARLVAAAFASLIARNYECGFLWVLRDNPSRYFYERVGGKAVAERREPMWGQALDQVCYGWPDLAEAVGRLNARGEV